MRWGVAKQFLACALSLPAPQGRGLGGGRKATRGPAEAVESKFQPHQPRGREAAARAKIKRKIYNRARGWEKRGTRDGDLHPAHLLQKRQTKLPIAFLYHPLYQRPCRCLPLTLPALPPALDAWPNVPCRASRPAPPTTYILGTATALGACGARPARVLWGRWQGCGERGERRGMKIKKLCSKDLWEERELCVLRASN